MPPRHNNPRPSPTLSLPQSISDWNRLLQQAIEQAAAGQSRHLPGLRQALVDGTAEKHLRKLGIICPTDIDREFPRPT